MLSKKSMQVAAVAYNTTLEGKARAMLVDILKYHPELKKQSKEFKSWALAEARAWDTEYLFEQTLAHLGGYKLIGESHADFSDKSDAKTSSVTRKVYGRNTITHVGRITSVGREGSLKHGALRCAIYIPMLEKMHYFYLPKRYWSTLTMAKSRTGELTIPFTYNSVTEIIGKFYKYQVPTLKDLAEACG